MLQRFHAERRTVVDVAKRPPLQGKAGPESISAFASGHLVGWGGAGGGRRRRGPQPVCLLPDRCSAQERPRGDRPGKPVPHPGLDQGDRDRRPAAQRGAFEDAHGPGRSVRALQHGLGRGARPEAHGFGSRAAAAGPDLKAGRGGPG